MGVRGGPPFALTFRADVKSPCRSPGRQPSGSIEPAASRTRSQGISSARCRSKCQGCPRIECPGCPLTKVSDISPLAHHPISAESSSGLSPQLRRASADNHYCRIKMARRPRQLDLPAPRTWGGRRPGAGRRPCRGRRGPAHSCRPEHDVRLPVHATLRARCGVPPLRSAAIFPVLRDALAASSHGSFRLLHFSVQSDHLHLIVEADRAQALSRGLQGLAVRCARAINRCSGRRGSVWSQRYHAHPLGTPREVRLALVYVLLNFRKHLQAPPAVDPCSSGPWFDGWQHPPPAPAEPSPIKSPRTSLASAGWRRAGGPIDCCEAPAPSPPLRRARIRPEFPDNL
jgi:hypothetical protein